MPAKNTLKIPYSDQVCESGDAGNDSVTTGGMAVDMRPCSWLHEFVEETSWPSRLPIWNNQQSSMPTYEDSYGGRWRNTVTCPNIRISSLLWRAAIESTRIGRIVYTRGFIDRATVGALGQQIK
jgi:hypothetical protein